MEITAFDQLDLNEVYSYADYLTWKFKERVELFKGKILAMSPAPSRQHQVISLNLSFELQKYLQRSPCQVFYAPFDVRLQRQKENTEVHTVVQPDICVVCDATKLDDKGCVGAPELVIEILSPGNSRKEMNQKFSLYEEAGVLEYWLVQPLDECLFQYILQNDQFVTHKPFTTGDTLKSQAIQGFEMRISDIFA